MIHGFISHIYRVLHTSTEKKNKKIDHKIIFFSQAACSAPAPMNINNIIRRNHLRGS
ncbi:hypothetical protein CFII64_20573 [Pseudomonas sp. CFII64]|nr:hypothetical protein CFII64_20573 [Pseudomonas sp. CFII64]